MTSGNEIRKKYGLKSLLCRLKQKCENAKHPQYYRYGGRGIKVLITNQEILNLWARDKGWLLKKPTIDRINNDGNYEFTNCQFIEREDNARKRENTLKGTCPKGHPYSGSNLYINETPNGHKLRVCRICKREGWARSRAKKRVERLAKKALGQGGE